MVKKNTAPKTNKSSNATGGPNKKAFMILDMGKPFNKFLLKIVYSSYKVENYNPI